jgi:hypothetical protein
MPSVARNDIVHAGCLIHRFDEAPMRSVRVLPRGKLEDYVLGFVWALRIRFFVRVCAALICTLVDCITAHDLKFMKNDAAS